MMIKLQFVVNFRLKGLFDNYNVKSLVVKKGKKKYDSQGT
jgi:hypothetical protein